MEEDWDVVSSFLAEHVADRLHVAAPLMKMGGGRMTQAVEGALTFELLAREERIRSHGVLRPAACGGAVRKGNRCGATNTAPACSA